MCLSKSTKIIHAEHGHVWQVLFSTKLITVHAHGGMVVASCKAALYTRDKDATIKGSKEYDALQKHHAHESVDVAIWLVPPNLQASSHLWKIR